jgi:hypothetical protein
VSKVKLGGVNPPKEPETFPDLPIQRVNGAGVRALAKMAAEAEGAPDFVPDAIFGPAPRSLPEWLDYCAEWIAEGVWDVPAIETRAEFKECTRQALEFCLARRTEQT